jgi:hypothetical protein
VDLVWVFGRVLAGSGREDVSLCEERRQCCAFTGDSLDLVR